MRVMHINRPKAGWIGGDYIQMESTAEELRKLGVEVDIEETSFAYAYELNIEALR
jgi:hypothetical protein